MINDPDLSKLSSIISHLYGPNPSNEILSTINSYKQYYLSNLDAFPHLFQVLVQSSNPHLSFWLIDQLILLVNTSYCIMSLAQRDKFRQSIAHTIKHSIISIYQLPYIANKFCFLIITWLKHDFPDNSQSFFKDLINDIAAVANNDEKMRRVVLFLDILLSFDEELIKYRHTFSKFEADKSTVIKDYMRINCIADISFLLTQVIENEQFFDKKIVSKAIRLIALLIDWNQLNLFEGAIGKILSALIQSKTYQAECFEVVNGLIKKGMDASLKIQIIQQLKLLNFINDVLSHTANNERLICIICETISNVGMFVLESYDLIKKAVKSGKNCDNELNYTNELLIFCINGANAIINIKEIGCKAALCFIDFLSALNSFLKVAENEIVQQTSLASLKELIYSLGKSFLIPQHIDLVNGNVSAMEEEPFFVYRREFNVIYYNFFCLKLLREYYLDSIIALAKQVQVNASLHNVENLLFLINSIAQGIKPEDITFIQEKFAEIIQLLFTFPFTETTSDFILLSYYDTLTRYLPYLIDNPAALDLIVKLYLGKKGVIYSNTLTGIKIAGFFEKFIEKTKPLFLQAKHSGMVQEILAKLKEYIHLIIDSNNFYCIGQYEVLFHSFSTVLSCVSSAIERNKHFEETLKTILSIFSKYGVDGEKFVEVCKCLTQLMNSFTTEVKDTSMREMMVLFFNVLITEYYNKVSGDKNKKITYAMITILQRLLIVLNAEAVKYIEFFLATQFSEANSIDAELFNENIKLLHNTVSQFKHDVKVMVAKFFNNLFFFTKRIEIPSNNISDIDKANSAMIGSFVRFVGLVFSDLPEVFIEGGSLFVSIDQLAQYVMIAAKTVIDQSAKKCSLRSLDSFALFVIKSTTQENLNANTTMLTWILNTTFDVYKQTDVSNQNDASTVKEIIRIHCDLEKSAPQFYVSYISKLIAPDVTQAFIALIHGHNIKQLKLSESLTTGFNVSPFKM